MQLRTDLALHAALRSLQQVVLPAVDPENGPAQEQLQVAIGLLALLAARLPLEFTFDCDELERLACFAAELLELSPDSAAGVQMAQALAQGQRVLASARVSPADLQAEVKGLREMTGRFISEAYAAADDVRRDALSALVLAHQNEQLTRERAWLLPQGWEPEPEALPALEALLAERKPAAD